MVSVYSHLYNSDKEILDAAKRIPFQHPALESLALDDELRASIQRAAGTVNHNEKALLA